MTNVHHKQTADIVFNSHERSRIIINAYVQFHDTHTQTLRACASTYCELLLVLEEQTYPGHQNMGDRVLIWLTGAYLGHKWAFSVLYELCEVCVCVCVWWWWVVKQNCLHTKHTSRLSWPHPHINIHRANLDRIQIIDPMLLYTHIHTYMCTCIKCQSSTCDWDTVTQLDLYRIQISPCKAPQGGFDADELTCGETHVNRHGHSF